MSSQCKSQGFHCWSNTLPPPEGYFYGEKIYIYIYLYVELKPLSATASTTHEISQKPLRAAVIVCS